MSRPTAAGGPGPTNSLSSPSSSRSVTHTVNGSHHFVIKGYSLAKGIGVGKHIASDNFTVGGYQWAIYFYPDGKNPEDHSTYVSVFIALASEGTDVRALFELTLLDQSGRGKHKVHSHFDRSLESGPYTLKYRGSMGYKRFYRRAMLETSDFLKDDCLRINCTVGVVVSETDCSRLPSIQVPSSDIGSHFGLLLDNDEYSDIVFSVAGERFNAHKLVISARSPKFEADYLDRMEESDDVVEIVVTDMDPKAMLHYIYKDCLVADEDLLLSTSSSTTSLRDSVVAELLAVADKYELSRLRLMCESFLSKHISVTSVADILSLADLCHASDLKSVCLKFGAENLVAVMNSEGFDYLKKNCPMLQSELLKMVAGEDELSSGTGKNNNSIWAQVSDGGNASNRGIQVWRPSTVNGRNPSLWGPLGNPGDGSGGT
ncbi:hypothetical protein V2J09_018637 [Rumex salicifolius]